jgi:hypothetical protein
MIKAAHMQTLITNIICIQLKELNKRAVAITLLYSGTINPDVVWSLIPIRQSLAVHMRSSTFYFYIDKTLALIASIFQAKASLTGHAERDRCRELIKQSI